MTNTKTHRGSCHCGHVKFEVAIDASSGAMCNCTACSKFGPRTGYGKPTDLKVTEGEADLALYGNEYMGRFFCPTCHVLVFGRGFLEELGGAFVAVNLNTLDDIDPSEIALMYWDGRHDNWEAGPGPKPFPTFREGEARDRLPRPVWNPAEFATPPAQPTQEN